MKSVNEEGVKHGHEMIDNFIRFFNQNNSIFAVNPKQALEQMKCVHWMLSMQPDMLQRY